jgi:hypothetical protein
VTDTSALKPCPWCKSDAHIDPNNSGLRGENWPRGTCDNCEALGPVADVMNDEADAAAKWNTRPEQQNADINAACDHHWVIPRFGEEDERVCSKCRVSAEEVTRAEQNTDINAVTDAMIAAAAKAYAEAIQFGHLGYAMKAALEAAMLTASPRQTEEQP